MTEEMVSNYLFFQGIKHKIPLSGTFELTPRCNLSCRMCYVRLSPSEMKDLGEELSSEQWLSIGEEARKKGMLFLLITGGEPLIREDFRYIFSKLSKMGLLISINSNGTLIDEEMIDFFKENPPYRINISLYGGRAETYERLCGNGSSFEKTIKAINGLKNAGLEVKLNGSLTPYNQEDIKLMLDIAKKAECYIQMGSYMFPPVRRNKAYYGKGDRFTPSEAARCSVVVDRLRLGDKEFACRAEKIIKGIEGYNSCEDCQRFDGDKVKCRAGRASFWINWRGMMSPCGMLVEPIENILKEDFDKAWDKIVESTEAIRLPKECVSCSVKEVCRPCAAMCYCETGSFELKPQYICDMNREMFKLIKEEYNRS